MAKNEAVSKLADQIHLAGQYAVYALVTLHVLATAWHLIARRDGLLDGCCRARTCERLFDGTDSLDPLRVMCGRPPFRTGL